MRVSTVLATLAAVASAAPSNAWGPWGQQCVVTDAYAQAYAQKSTVFLMHTDVAAANASAYSLFDPSIVEYGDSINSLKSEMLGKEVESGIASYVSDELHAPPIPSIDTLAIVHDCSHIVWQWQFNGIGSGKYRVRGFTLAHVNAAGLVDSQYVEFNGLAWGLDIGFNISVPAGLFGPGS